VRKELGTCDSKMKSASLHERRAIKQGILSSLKNGLKIKKFRDIDPIKKIEQ